MRHFLDRMNLGSGAARNMLEGCLSKHGEILRSMICSDSAEVLAQGHGEHPVQTVLNAPVRTCGVKNVGGPLGSAADNIIVAPLIAAPLIAAQLRGGLARSFVGANGANPGERG